MLQSEDDVAGRDAAVGGGDEGDEFHEAFLDGIRRDDGGGRELGLTRGPGDGDGRGGGGAGSETGVTLVDRGDLIGLAGVEVGERSRRAAVDDRGGSQEARALVERDEAGGKARA